MAISPYELEQNFEHELDVLEGEIDELLSELKIYRGDTITIIPPKGLKNKHFNILLSRYLSVGWTSVKWVENQKDGIHLEFKF